MQSSVVQGTGEGPSKNYMAVSSPRYAKEAQLSWLELVDALLTTGCTGSLGSHLTQVASRGEGWCAEHGVRGNYHPLVIFYYKHMLGFQKCMVLAPHSDITWECSQPFHCRNQFWFYRVHFSGSSATTTSLGPLPLLISPLKIMEMKVKISIFPFISTYNMIETLL